MSRPTRGHQGEKEATPPASSFWDLRLRASGTDVTQESRLRFRFKRGPPSSLSRFSTFHDVFLEGEKKNTSNDANLPPFGTLRKGAIG